MSKGTARLFHNGLWGFSNVVDEFNNEYCFIHPALPNGSIFVSKLLDICFTGINNERNFIPTQSIRGEVGFKLIHSKSFLDVCMGSARSFLNMWIVLIGWEGICIWWWLNVRSFKVSLIQCEITKYMIFRFLKLVSNNKDIKSFSFKYDICFYFPAHN